MAEDHAVTAAYVTVSSIPIKITGNGQKYQVMSGNQVLIELCSDPILDSARHLLGLGEVDIDDILILNSAQGKELMRGRVGALAHTRVAEGLHQGPRFTEWSPYFGPESGES